MTIPPIIPEIIEGGSHFKFCEESLDPDLFAIDLLSVNPTPQCMRASCLISHYDVLMPRASEREFNADIYGTFLKDITANAIMHWLIAEPDNHDQHDSGLFWFCDTMSEIELPNPNHEDQPSCPPVK